ncbi:MAG: hypothetical protein J6S24_06230 [Lentisphaeria bacterium]|nr:hypothetical protein [Lentisphaeria bacterium]
MNHAEQLIVRDGDTKWITNEICQYGDKYLKFVRELPDKSFEMVFCDKNGNIEPDGPVVISLPDMSDTGCIRQID